MMRRFVTSSPRPGPSRQSQAQEEDGRNSSQSELSLITVISDSDYGDEMSSRSRASSMSTSTMSLDSVASMATTTSETVEMASDVDPSDAEDTVQGTGSVLDAQDELKRSLQGLQDFFKFHKLESSKVSQKYGDKKHLHKGMANCQKCRQTIKFDSESRGNLKKHYKTKHPGIVKALVAAMSLNKFKTKVGLKSDKARRQLTLMEATQKPNVWSQEAAQLAYVVWFAESLKPLCDIKLDIYTCLLRRGVSKLTLKREQ